MDKEKYTIEHVFKSSTKLLYARVSTADGLSEWFADDVQVKEGHYTFVWGDDEQVAKVVQKKEGQYIRFHWVDDEEDNSYFEFRIEVDDITRDVALLITDFAYPEDKEDNIELWEAQMDDLHAIIG